MENDLFNDKYRLFVNFGLLQNIPNKINGYLEIAKIRNISKKEDVMFVLYDKNHYAKTNYMMHTSIINKDGKNYWCAIIYDEYLMRMQKNLKIASFGLYHELGHFINNDVGNINKEFGNSELRKKTVENGKVLESEIRADEFAVKQVGKSCAINFLDYCITRRKAIDNSRLAILELELRKKHIKNLK